MITKNLLVAALSVAALGVGSASLAAPTDGSLPGPVSAVPPSMMAGPMAGNVEARGPMGYGMMGPGMMGDGAVAGGGMMGACQGMMGGAGLDSATAMRMHGEMMRAMGDILVKYAGKAEPTVNR
ncbi:MAG: hypothetical protein K8F51_05320 [Comamonas sp.]|nr:hypothetical protein [Comamonas sp.]